MHALALQPDQLEKEFSIEPEIPEGAFTTTATIRAFIDEYNAELPPLLSADDIKRRSWRRTTPPLPAPVPLGGDKDAIGIAYLELPDEFKRIVGDDKNFTASAMRPASKNTTPPCQRLLEPAAAAMPYWNSWRLLILTWLLRKHRSAQPLKVSGNKADLIQAVKSVETGCRVCRRAAGCMAREPGRKVLVTRQQLATALAIQSTVESPDRWQVVDAPEPCRRGELFPALMGNRAGSSRAS